MWQKAGRSLALTWELGDVISAQRDVSRHDFSTSLAASSPQ